MRLGPPPEVEPEIPGQFWKDFIRDTAPVFRNRRSSSSAVPPADLAGADRRLEVRERRLVEIFDELQPDVIVEDNVVAFPAIEASGRPWARIVSCNPLELTRPDLPPVFSGYPTADRAGWNEFEAEHRRTHDDMWHDFDAFVQENGAPGLPRARVHARVAVSQPLRLSGARSTTRAARAAGADLAPARVLGPRDGRRVGGAGRARGPATGSSSTSASAASARPTSS